MKLPPPALTALLALGMWWLTGRSPVLDLSWIVRFGPALLLLLPGVGMALAGVMCFRRADTTINPFTPDQSSTLVTSGVYRLSRNPMYLGMLLVLLAWSVWLAAPLALLGPVLFMVWITCFQILPEERVLRRRFGLAFDDYSQRVRRWL